MVVWETGATCYVKQQSTHHRPQVHSLVFFRRTTLHCNLCPRILIVSTHSAAKLNVKHNHLQSLLDLKRPNWLHLGR